MRVVKKGARVELCQLVVFVGGSRLYGESEGHALIPCLRRGAGLLGSGVRIPRSFYTQIRGVNLPRRNTNGS